MELTNNLSEKALYDYKVVKRAITGDEQAYAELFKRYKDSVYFMILKMVNNRTGYSKLPLITRLILFGRKKPKLFLWIRMI